MNPVSQLRKSYELAVLNEADLDPDPVRQFARWLKDAAGAGVLEPSAMTLATVSQEGTPSARIVLLKDFDHRGFTFFTNYASRKGRELDANPQAALLFFWPELERQVRVSGSVARVSREESEAYFHSRPRGSQLGAWASEQSERVGSRAELDARFAEASKRFEGGPIPLPPFWGGYRLAPVEIEFWQGGPNRLHDRFRYLYTAKGIWDVARLYP